MSKQDKIDVKPFILHKNAQPRNKQLEPLKQKSPLHEPENILLSPKNESLRVHPHDLSRHRHLVKIIQVVPVII